MTAGRAGKEKLIIFDTTLRDGEQSPNVTLHIQEKLEIARNLSMLGVDVCEAGFPVASEGDFLAVQSIARQIGKLMINREKIGKPMAICALARATKNDIHRAYDAVKDAPLHRIHTFLATSDIHLEYKLKISREECIKKATEAVQYAKSLVDDVEFSPEDAGRSDKAFLCQVLGNVIEAGAKTLNIPDTVGYTTPEEYGKMIKYLKENTPNGDKVVWSTHCHNDLGLATANTLSGVQNGARQVEVTINGIGERAGNTALEEIVMTLFTHPNYYPVRCDINTNHIYRISQLISQKTGMMVQPNKAIVGANAFAHESGIHQDGVLKHQQTYEIIDPAVIGLTSNSLVLGKHSGRNAFRSKLSDLGLTNIPDVKFQHVFERFKKIADSKKNVTDHDILAILDDEMGLDGDDERYQFRSLNVVTNPSSISTATLELIDTHVTKSKTPEDNDDSEDIIKSNILVDASISRNGPIDAIFRVVSRLTHTHFILSNFEVKSVGGGLDAIGQASVRIREANKDELSPSESLFNGDSIRLQPVNGIKKRKTSESPQRKENGKKSEAHDINEVPPAKSVVHYHGHGSDTDILVASARALLKGINKLIGDKKEGNKRTRTNVESRSVNV